jgi:hypothetical protein
MRRLSLYLGTLSWWSRLQVLVLLIILGFQAQVDIKHGIWPVTVFIVFVTVLIGWLLKPLMVAHPRTAYRIWSSFGIVFLITFLLCHKQWWWRTVAAHFGREFALWLELSCGYWFISELRLKQEQLTQEPEPDPDPFATRYEEPRQK